MPWTRTTRTVLLPVLLVGCLGVLALPADRATAFTARPASAPAAAAATVLLPAGTEVDPSAVNDKHAAGRTFVTAPPAGPPVIGPSAIAEVERVASAPVDTAAVEAEAVVALSGPAGATDGPTGIPVTVLAA